MLIKTYTHEDARRMYQQYFSKYLLIYLLLKSNYILQLNEMITTITSRCSPSDY